MGLKYAMENFLRFVNWDRKTRNFKITPIPGNIEINEFDYRDVNEVVYDENGVVFRTWPDIHAGDGPVSYALEYAGLNVVFGGDTVPNKWFLEYAKDADVIIHEAMMLPEQWVEFYAQPPQLAWRACCEFHTSPQSFGKIMSAVRPRLAVGYHIWSNPEYFNEVIKTVSKTYDGAFVQATDLTVINVTDEDIVVREAVVSELALPTGTTKAYLEAYRSKVDADSKISEFLASGRWKGFKPPPLPKQRKP